tara:strand:+ start:1903 stop:2667 length:765 start_codon:yes stop_codon:yes gene_type:complete
MQNLLPDQTGLEILAVRHRYTITKDREADATVTIANKRLSGEGNIFEKTHNWDGIDGSTKVGFDVVPTTLGSLWGDGSISTTGGELSDITIQYSYQFDPCFIAISNPECAGFQDALYQYLLDNNLIDNEPSVTDPYYDQWVQYQLKLKTEQEEVEEKEVVEEDETEEEINVEQVLSITGKALEVFDTKKQQAMMNTLIGDITAFNAYSQLQLDGGVYKETLVMDGGQMKDNFKAYKSMSNSSKYDKIFKSQYNN